MDKCKRPGCSGTITDGFCEDCGKPPVGVTTISATPASSGRGSGGDTFATGSAATGTGTRGAGSGVRKHTSRSSRGSSSRRSTLGGGLVSLPPFPSQDPLKLVMEKAEVPERKRRCPKCDAKVTRTRGFCGQCGGEYNFEPSLNTGDVINGKFEIKGAIAFGGLGWIYLGWDLVLNRWVVMKGLLNAKDEAAAAAAVAERQFLAAVKHPKIVGIYDFLKNGNEGYIVMEYVGGKCIGNIVKEKGVLPVEEAITYILGILPAFSYLHANGMVYCDFKPDNFMMEGDDVKLIDMGGVRRIGDPNGDIYGTRGYMAPEASDDPVEVSDLYTIGRALAVMTMDFASTREFEKSLPLPKDQPVLAQNESFYRFLLRATHQDPDQRFQSADEMADQLLGVLREIVALRGDPKPAESNVFTSDNLFDADDFAGTQSPDVRLLPALKANPQDPASNDILRLAGITDPAKRVSGLEALAKKFGEKSVEARLRLAHAYMGMGRFTDLNKVLDKLFSEDPFDWRVSWYRGKALLSQGDGKAARQEFGKVYFEMPGELAPKLAIAFAAEAMGNTDEAAGYYSRVAKVDPNQTTACFGLARCQIKKGNLAGAMAALAAVPAQHSLFTQARIILASTILMDEAKIDQTLLEKAAETIESISVEGGVVHGLAAKLLANAVAMLSEGKVQADEKRKLLGHILYPFHLRKGAETEYRNAARFADSHHEKIRLIDMANAIRPQSLV